MTDLVWLGGEVSFQLYQDSLRRLDEYRLAHGGPDAAKLWSGKGEEEESAFGGYDDMVTLHGDVAVVQIAGSLVSSGWGRWGRYFGIVGYDEIRNALVEVANSGKAKSVLLDVRSSGGSAAGIGELTDFMANFKQIMPVYSFTGVEALSAGQWILSFGQKAYAGKMASVGSIGVISVYMDVTERLKQDGVKPVVIRSGSQKALGNGLEPITEEVKKKLQERSDRYHDFFKGQMAQARGLAGAQLDEIAQGQVFFAMDAMPALVDGLKSFDEVVIELNARHTSAQRDVTGDTNVKRQLNAAGLAAVEAGQVSMEAALADAALSDAVEDEEEGAAGAEGTAAAGEGEGEGEGTGEGEAAAEGDDAGAGAEGEGTQAQAGGESAVLMAKVESLMLEKLEAGVKLKASEQEATQLRERVTGLEADIASMREIIVAGVTGMQTAMGLPQSSATLQTLSVADLVKLHASLRSDMGKKFPVGPVGRRGTGGAQAPQQHGMVSAVQAGSKLNLVK